ncbi:formin-like protein 5 [Morus notabilis]|uniref:formin-like protein 5 n=1 Tax=Morus notabilis TaxID=981085 RepID=UPI000CED6475|nr:formin-like protein 5 [Morus notabilis]XP_024018696.1 formin-like protein 5 [Morus notabilis]
MGVLRTSCFIVLAILLCAWSSRSSDEKKNSEEVLLRQLVDPASGEIDGNLAEELWFYCKLDVIHLKEFVKELDLRFPKEIFSRTYGIDPKGLSLARENIEKSISFLHPQVKHTLLECLQKHNILLRDSGEDSGSRSWYSKYFESIFPGDNVPRRYLQTISGAPAPSSATGSPSPSPGPAPSPSQPPSSDPPAPSPRTQFSPPVVNDPDLGVPPAENSSSSPGSDVQPDKKSNSHRAVIIAVAVTASVTFVVVALFFLCCGGFCKPGSKVGRNDERPLLSLSLSDFSVGSSPKFYAFGNSTKEEGLGQQSFGNNSSQNRMGSSLDGNFHMASSVIHTSFNNTVSTTGASEFKTFDVFNNTNPQVPNPPLKPPPGRVVPTPMGMGPLKPPPGRADPLPPEPPSSFKPPSSKPSPPPRPSSKPPPPPPVPQPSQKPAGSQGPPPPPKPSPPPPPSPLPSGSSTGPRPPPPPPPKGGVPPRPPQLPLGPKGARPPPPAPKHPLNASSSEGADLEGEADAPKAKLKPFFWDKVLANPDHSMVWHQIKSGSFQFDENMIETLFGYAATDKGKSEQKKNSPSQDPSPQFIQIIDPKKSQNLAILLRALNVTIEEVCDALREGNELPLEFLESLLKMTPTTDEELKLRMFNGELSQLGPAERFLKVLVDIPFAFKRLEALLFMSTLTEEVAIAKESFATLEVACKELKNSRLFLKLLEAVLKTGNRMNDGTFRGGAQAFKLDTLLKLSDVKGTDGKTTLLHFVVQEIIRSEGIRAARVARENRSLSSIKSDDLLEESSNDVEEHYRSLGLQVVSGLGNELEYVKRAALLDADSLTGTVAKLGQSLLKTRKFLNSEMKNLEKDGGFCQTLENFVQNAEVEISVLLEEEKRITALVKSTGDYFHGNAGKDEGLRLFIIVRDLLIMLDKTCREVREAQKKRSKVPKKETSSSDVRQLAAPTSTSDTRQSPVDLRERLFPAITDRRMDSSSSDDESP